LPLVYYGVILGILPLAKKYRLTLFENRLLARLFGPKSRNLVGDWRKVHNEWLHYFNSSPDITRMMKSKKMVWRRFIDRPRYRGNKSSRMDLRVVGGVVLHIIGISIVFGTVLL
jgi:hypothetical protein